MHYWAIRQFDLRGLQRRLAAFGLSSLGRSQGHVASTLNAIGTAARALAHSDDPDRLPPNGYTAGANVLRRRTFELLGPAPARRSTRIMVTLPGTAAADPSSSPISSTGAWTSPGSTAPTTIRPPGPR